MIMSKSEDAYKTIGEVVKILKIKSRNKNVSPTHTIRYWEKEFKQIKPKILNGNRRYYDKKNIELLKKVHFLLKEQGMTINGVKKLLSHNDPLKLDEISNQSIRTDKLKSKLTKISSIIKKLKYSK
jgi:DNA-binding transcriptional MerR regulator